MYPGEEAFPSYRPSIYYFRQALRKSDDPEELREIGMLLCRAYEMERAWIRAKGMIPPKDIVLTEEAEAKGWIFQSDGDPAQTSLPFGSESREPRSS